MRNNRKIPYDSDIDVGICEDQLSNFNKAMDYLCNNGEIIKKVYGSLFVYQLSSKNVIHIDMYVYKKKQNNMYTCMQYNSTPESFFLEDELFPLKKTTFENIEVLIPNKVIKYLEANYGKGCIENPITKHSYIDNYVKCNGTKGDLPDKNTWNKLLQNNKD